MGSLELPMLWEGVRTRGHLHGQWEDNGKYKLGMDYGPWTTSHCTTRPLNRPVDLADVAFEKNKNKKSDTK